jgi:hypothetical protein
MAKPLSFGKGTGEVDRLCKQTITGFAGIVNSKLFCRRIQLVCIIAESITG